VNRFESLNDDELAAAIAEKTATAHKERTAAALFGVPAHLAMAKQIEEEIVELKAEQSKRIAQ
jgi:HPt (histidine-containing phosphotransfer) domain-containing protein